MTCSSKLSYKDTKALYFSTAQEVNSRDFDFLRAHELKLRLILIQEVDPVMERACRNLREQIDAIPHKRYKPEDEDGRTAKIDIDEDVIPI
jgi:hypothetical protein